MNVPQRKSEATPLVVSLATGVLKGRDGQTYTIADGERVRADHPLVKAYPAMFTPPGLTDAERIAAKADWLAARDRAA